QRLYFPNKHQRLKVTLILSEPRGKIGNPIYAFRSRYLRTEHIRVLDIVLFASKLPNRLYGKSPPLVGVQQSAEDERTVKRGPTQPRNVAVFLNVGQITAISNNPALIYMPIFHTSDIIRIPQNGNTGSMCLKLR